jgi:hypothetical protein
MLIELWPWLMRWSELITNFLDLLAFILAAPEIIGRERLAGLHDRLEQLRSKPYYSIMLILLIGNVLIFCSGIAVSVVETGPFMLLKALTGPWLERHILFAEWLEFLLALAPPLLTVIAFDRWLHKNREVDSIEGVWLLMQHLYRAARCLVLDSPLVLTPRGMLFIALALFLFSRLLSVAHALAMGS